MKEIIDVSTLQEVKKMIKEQPQKTETNVVNVHCSWCTNCSGIVGD